jgi:tetratricopeptide (TPR) repeat protein
MKHATMLIVILALATFVSAQDKPAAQTTPPPAGATAPAQPAGKRPPQAKTQAEFDAYKVAVANTDPAAMEKAADDFATKFPDSELRVLLYRAAMHAYQSANKADEMMGMGRKVLKLDPDDPEASVGVAQVLAERTRDTDLDKDQRLDEGTKLAQHSLETVDTDVAFPPGTPPDKMDEYKGFLRSTAYYVLGTIAYTRAKYPEAEGYFRKSIDALPSQPDPLAVLRLALSLDKQEKYPEALKFANQAVQMTESNQGSALAGLSRNERDRLVQLTGGTPAKPPAPAPKN